MSAPPDTARRAAESVARGLVVLVMVGVAFSPTWARLLGEVDTGAGSWMVVANPAGALATLVTLQGHRRAELPIHDRQSDKIVGTVIVAVALMVQWLVVPRYGRLYVLLHIDVTAAWLFGLGCSVFVFGIRRTAAFWPAWIVLFIPTPGALRLIAFLLGGGQVAQIVVVSAVILAGPVAVWVYRTVRGWPGHSHWTGPAVSAREAWRSVPLLVAVTVALALAPLPATARTHMAEGPPTLTGKGQVVPEGWRELSTAEYPWAERMYGPSSTLYRQIIRAREPRADWDALSRPRQAAVQTLTVEHPGLFDAYPLEMIYDMRGSRLSEPIPVELPRGVSARYTTVVDDEKLLTWSLLTFVWSRGEDRYQRITILTIDNHEQDAEFPPAIPATVSVSERLLALQLRGAGAVTAVGTQQKDLDMLTELGGDLVEAQWTAR